LVFPCLFPSSTGSPFLHQFLYRFPLLFFSCITLPGNFSYPQMPLFPPPRLIIFPTDPLYLQAGRPFFGALPSMPPLFPLIPSSLRPFFFFFSEKPGPPFRPILFFHVVGPPPVPFPKPAFFFKPFFGFFFLLISSKFLDPFLLFPGNFFFHFCRFFFALPLLPPRPLDTFSFGLPTHTPFSAAAGNLCFAFPFLSVYAMFFLRFLFVPFFKFFVLWKLSPAIPS